MAFPEAMGVIVLEGLLITALVLTGFREAVLNAIPMALKKAIGIGIGLFIALIGLVNAGIVVHPEAGQPILHLAGDLTTLKTLTFVVGLVLAGLVVPVAVTPLLWAGADGGGVLARVLVAWHQGLGGVLAGAACLALVALAASGRGAGTGVLGQALTATGKRALSAYLAQTVLMALTAGALRLWGVDALALAWQLLVAAVVWSVSVLLCRVAEGYGVRGPAEQLLRQWAAADPRG